MERSLKFNLKDGYKSDKWLAVFFPHSGVLEHLFVLGVKLGTDDSDIEHIILPTDSLQWR